MKFGAERREIEENRVYFLGDEMMCSRRARRRARRSRIALALLKNVHSAGHAKLTLIFRCIHFLGSENVLNL